MEITLEKLPQAVFELRETVNNIERLLLQKSNEQPVVDCWFDLTELCNYLPDKPVKATAYGWVHHSLIPYHKRAKKLFFLKSEIDQWLKAGRKKTLAETEAEAREYVTRKNRK